MSNGPTRQLRCGALAGLALLVVAPVVLADSSFIAIKRQLREDSFIFVEEGGEHTILFIGEGPDSALPDTKSPRQRAEELHDMDESRDTNRFGRLVASLSDPSAHVRLSAIRLLGEIDSMEARLALEPMLDHPDPDTRLEVVEAIADTPGARPLLRRACSSGDRVLAETACEYLAEGNRRDQNSQRKPIAGSSGIQ